MSNGTLTKTVTIIIKGVSLCYEKDTAGGRVMKILFPFDHCHLIKFFAQKGSEPAQFIRNMGTSNNQIEVVLVDAVSTHNTTTRFKNTVLDMTEAGKTHDSLVKRFGDFWNETAVLLTIPNAVFDVSDFVQDIQGVQPHLRRTDSEEPKTVLANLVAHSIQAVIELPVNRQLTVTSPALPQEFSTQGSNSYILTFDNDCPEKRGVNDMEMLYNDIIKDPEFPNRQFHVEGPDPIPVPTPTASAGFMVDPPLLAHGKPCMVVRVSKPDDLP